MCSCSCLYVSVSVSVVLCVSGMCPFVACVWACESVSCGLRLCVSVCV